jgi:2-keto-4-pentenoate hydratase/2-oxohepta-3-ene-1,7-dioic acid hydratase in catechol pathway
MAIIMRIVRFSYKDRIAFGVLKEKTIAVLRYTPFVKIIPSGEKIPLQKVRLLSPTLPSKVILVGLNYRDHARELNMPIPKEPIIFLKPLTAVIGHNDKIIYPKGVTRLDYEAELALVIKKQAKNITVAKAGQYILGYTCLNDVTARDLQKKDGQWTRAKSFDTFCPVGPWVETDIDPGSLRITLFLNNALKQDSSTRNLIFPVEKLVSFISGIMTLYPGDIISTGTPPGVGPMKPGDRVEVGIEGIGTLVNSVVKG